MPGKLGTSYHALQFVLTPLVLLRPNPPWRSVMVLKKLGPELLGQLLEVVRFLGEEQGMRVVVERHDYDALVS